MTEKFRLKVLRRLRSLDIPDKLVTSIRPQTLVCERKKVQAETQRT